ncbi:hypothetical protein KC318_g461 [Hortaea werneckii]|nr:hypothetical protein KC334_g433 [Hortaea werneckii]KAI7027281.1 hypothetical protein KC355_g391 [Hortaea werneckii]KAI7676129.1 hypothetical protein KC318_g461 [Hortaea werneckii]
MTVEKAPAPLIEFEYDLLPFSELKPQGWIQEALRREAEGLAGHLYEFYRYVHNSTWLGGEYEYSELHEAAPYWYNALVPLAYILEDERLIGQVNGFLDHVLSHQQADGWLGPETDPHARGLWARTLLLQGMANHAMAAPEREDEIVSAMHSYVKLTHRMLSNNFTGFLPHADDTFDPYRFGVSRAHEYSLSLQWLYENHPRNQSDTIWEVMVLMWEGASIADSDWRTFFTEQNFTIGASGAEPKKIEHGVTLAEGLRYMAQMYRMNRDKQLVTQTRNAINMTFQYQVGPSGTVIGDEYLGGRSPQRGSELCMTVETMFSTAYLFRLFGDNDYAEKAERAAYNALPAAIMPDWWSHQYVTQTNQPWSQNLSAQPYYNVVPYGNVFGLEPNFPCCTVNHPAAYPKFFSSAVLSKGSEKLLHAFLVPFSLDTTINGSPGKITCNTSYPFGHTLEYEFKAEKSFTFGVRLPEWMADDLVIQTRSQDIAVREHTQDVCWCSIPAGQSKLSVALKKKIQVLPQPIQGTVAVYYGALLYALDIAHTVSETPALNWTDRTPLPADQIVPSVHDHTVLPVQNATWDIAIDPTQIHAVQDHIGESSAGANQSSVSLFVAATQITWPITNGTAGLPPTPPLEVSGSPFMAKLVPYGSARLHIAEFPTVRQALLSDDVDEQN